MASFLRPGARQASAFGVSFDTDREAAGAAPPPPHRTAHERLSLSEQRRRLPIYEHRDHILYLVENHATTVLIGETGSGKTTQVPQYLHEAGWTRSGMVVCTQPRRVAAMTVAQRVADEMGCPLGQAVGYAIRFEDVSTPGVTKLRFCTDGVLLREMAEDPLISKYAVIIVDEAHERSLASDVLLGLLKKVQRRRPGLRIIVSSATLEADKIAAFFDTSTSRAPHSRRPLAHGSGAEGPSRSPALLSIAGRTHSVQLHYLQQPASDYVAAAVEAAVNIHLDDLPGDVLIFLTGQEECERAVAMLAEEERRLRGKKSGFRGDSGKQQRLRLAPLPLYAGLPAAAQLAAVSPPPRGSRHVVVSTNVAETSITVEGVVYVIDCMFAKQRCYDPLVGLESLVVTPVSRASAAQRAGRAGRIRPGHCFRLCTEQDFEQALAQVEVPEMRRSDLTDVLLQLKALGIDNMMTFDWVDAPPAESIIRALESLHALGALDSDARLTQPLGAQMAALPVSPQLARALVAGSAAGCALEVATVAAALSVQSVWAPGPRAAVHPAQAQFAVGEGDLITYLNVYRAWEESGRNKHWAVENFVHHRAMLRVTDVRAQLAAHMRRAGLPVASALSRPVQVSTAGAGMEESLVAVRKALTAGLFLNVAVLTEEVDRQGSGTDSGRGVYRLVRSGGAAAAARLRLHPSSVLFRCRPAAVCFHLAQQTEAGWYEMQDVLAIDPAWLPDLAPHYFLQTPAGAGHGT